jgi:hypothetical protein
MELQSTWTGIRRCRQTKNFSGSIHTSDFEFLRAAHMNKAKIFLIDQEGKDIKEMLETSYSTEDVLQRLLVLKPGLLPGDLGVRLSYGVDCDSEQRSFCRFVRASTPKANSVCLGSSLEKYGRGGSRFH